MAQPIPRDIVQVEGCNCTGAGDYYLVTCSIHDLDEEQYRLVVDAAQNRVREYLSLIQGLSG